MGTILGAVIGTTSSRVVQGVWTTLIDGINAFPLIILIIAIVAAIGPGVTGIVVAVLLTNWARYARIARARALVVSKADYVQALRMLGYSRPRVILRHVLPNTYTETLAYAFSDFVIIVTTVAGLSFLGLGVRPPDAEWRAMMSEGRLFLSQAPWVVVFPGLALSLTATGVALLAAVEGARRRSGRSSRMRPWQSEPLLRVRNVEVTVSSPDGGRLPIIDRADFTIGHEESLGIVGESGSGKSMLCRALIGTLHRYSAAVTGGSIRFDGHELSGASERTWRTVRGRSIGYVPQSSMAGLNPVLTVGAQLLEAIRADRKLGRQEARDEAIRYLQLVQLPRPADLLRKRPHELSGGMKQRVMIAAALARKPRLLLADEPTTALDVSVQRDILAMLKELRVDLGMTLVLVSHDLAVIEEVCDRVLVMYAGATIEEGGRRRSRGTQASVHRRTPRLDGSTWHAAVSACPRSVASRRSPAVGRPGAGSGHAAPTRSPSAESAPNPRCGRSKSRRLPVSEWRS